MTIGIEAERANNAEVTGVEQYAKQLILHLAKLDQKNTYILYLRTKPHAWFSSLPSNFKVKVIPFPIFWTQIRISLEMLFYPVDALLIPASALPLIHPKNSVITIHDTAWLFYPEMFSWFMRNYLHWSTKFASKFAKSILVNSTATKKDLMKHYGVPEEKIHLTLFGTEGPPEVISGPSSEIATLLPKQYVIFVSTLQPRKNVPGLIAAFRQLKSEHPELPHKLVMIGRKGWLYEESVKAIEDNKDIVVYLGHASDQNRWGVLAKADALIQPSFYEGFGMSILDAFAVGVPVATSNVSSLPEVGGPGAIYFDPKNVSEIKNAIKQILLDRGLHDRLAANGREHLKNFSWERCAKETLDAILLGD